MVFEGVRLDRAKRHGPRLFFWKGLAICYASIHSYESDAAQEANVGKPRVGIVGAGPGGLVAARILSLHEVDIMVFEREGSFSERSQGGSLDIHADVGQVALHKAGLMNEFSEIARYADQETRVYDKHGVLRLLDTEIADKNRPETDRGHLRKMLLDSLPVGVVRWDAAVVGVAPRGHGSAMLFADGTEQTFDLIVGADGTWSKIRPAVSSIIPKYTGILVIEFGIDKVEQRFPDTAAMAGRGLTFALGDTKSIASHRNADDHMGGYIGLPVPEDWFQQRELDRLDAHDAREVLCEEFAGWSEDLLLWIRRSDGSLVARPIYELPSGHRWDHREGLTLIGDAAHVMSPFGGDGANLAMVDGADLAEALIQVDWRTAVDHFEKSMSARAKEPARMASQAIQGFHSPQGLDYGLQAFANQGPP